MILAIVISLAYLLLYCVQQLGVTLGVGAETVLLVAYLQSIRDGVIDDNERGFARAVRRVKDIGLLLIILSGIAIVGLQFYQNQITEFFSIIVLFKWSLIGIALFFVFLTKGYSLAEGLLRGLSAGTWYALFAVHILGPTAPWLALGMFYGLWLVGFALCWSVLVFSARNKAAAAHIKATPVSKAPKQPAPHMPEPVQKPVVAAQPTPPAKHDPLPHPSFFSTAAPVQTQAQPQSQPKPQPPQKPVEPATFRQPLRHPKPSASMAAQKTNTESATSDTPISPILLNIMPKTPEDLAKQKTKPV